MGRVPLKDNSDQQAGGNKISEGVYLKTAEILEVMDQSNYPGHKVEHYTKDKSKPRELWLVVTIKDGDYERDMFFSGRFKWVDGKAISWDPFLNTVQRLLAKVLGKESEIEETDLSIPKDVLKKLEGRQFQFISYQSGYEYEAGKFGYNRWPYIFSMDQDYDEIKADWDRNVEYVKDFRPDIAAEKAASSKKKRYNPSDEDFNYGANVEDTEGSSDNDAPFDPDVEII